MDREKTTKAGKKFHNYYNVVSDLVFLYTHNNKMPDNQSLFYHLL